MRKMSLGYFVELYLEVDGEMTVRQGHAIAYQVKEDIMRKKPAVYDVLVRTEPQ